MKKLTEDIQKSISQAMISISENEKIFVQFDRPPEAKVEDIKLYLSSIPLYEITNPGCGDPL